MTTSPTACRAWSSCSRPARPRAWRRSRGGRPGPHRGHRQDAQARRRPRRRLRGDRLPGVASASRLLVEDGDHVEVGQQLIAGRDRPASRCCASSARARCSCTWWSEVQEVYRSQGVSIHDKHIEVIVRQMLQAGDDHRVGRRRAAARASSPSGRGSRRRTVAWSPRAARRRPAGPSSWASPRPRWRPSRGCRRPPSRRRPGCSRTRRSTAKSDPLLGLKENVIIGKLIPAGTGLPRYRNIRVEPTEEAKAAMYSMPGYDDCRTTRRSGPGPARPSRWRSTTSDAYAG